MVTDVQAPFLKTPLVPLKFKAPGVRPASPDVDVGDVPPEGEGRERPHARLSNEDPAKSGLESKGMLRAEGVCS